MRFHITVFGRRGLSVSRLEVIGEEIKMPDTNERFAVHNDVMLLDEQADEFVVSHIETGFRVATANSIDAAIDAAKATIAEKGAHRLNGAIARARKRIAKRSQ